MRKLFMISAGLFAFVFAFSAYETEGEISVSQAFADGSCKKESGSICGLNGKNYRNKYLDCGCTEI